MGPRPGSGGNMGRTGGVSPLSSLSGESELGRWRCVVRPRRGAGRGGQGTAGDHPREDKGAGRYLASTCTFAQRSHAANKGSESRLHATASHRKFATVQIAWRVCCQVRGWGSWGSTARGAVLGDQHGCREGCRATAEVRKDGGRDDFGVDGEREMDSLVNVFHRADLKTFSRGEEASMGDIAIRANMAFSRRRGSG